MECQRVSSNPLPYTAANHKWLQDYGSYRPFGHRTICYTLWDAVVQYVTETIRMRFRILHKILRGRHIMTGKNFRLHYIFRPVLLDVESRRNCHSRALRSRSTDVNRRCKSSAKSNQTHCALDICTKLADLYSPRSLGSWGSTS